MSTEKTFSDLTINCIDCKEPFLFTVGEQEWYANQVDKKTGKPFAPPKRCKTCREKKRAEREARGQ